ncbi:MAG: XylR family transcriptional regulator [Verrucomicrobiaceae bacterium]|nr:XylR family transcriptional regulator [Verrucomicrobiaceae bacterium]
MKNLRVALLVETSREYGRGLLRGIIRYQRKHGPWSITFQPHGLGEPPPAWLRTWKGDGIIARINDSTTAQALMRLRLPLIDLRTSVPGLNLPTVGIENRLVVRMAVDHFMERGFRHFAFCGTPYGQHVYQDERSDRFRAELKARGFKCDVYQHLKTKRGAEQELKHLTQWLAKLPRPCALMTCHDDRGQQVLDACLRAGFAVPDEIAVLGVDNDEFLCHLTTPPMSSIDVDSVQIGHEAAALLDQLMHGKKPPRQPRYFPPRRIIERQSTSIIAVEDHHVASTARRIRDGACTAQSVDEVLRGVPLSRSAAYRRFRQQLGRSPKQEQMRLRITRARELLEDTDLSIAEIARRVGYVEAKYFIHVFKHQTGATPLKYRKEKQGR